MLNPELDAVAERLLHVATTDSGALRELHSDFLTLSGENQFAVIMLLAEHCFVQKIKFPALRTAPGVRVDAAVADDQMAKAFLDAYRILSFHAEDLSFCRTIFAESPDPFYIATTFGGIISGEGR